MSASVGQRSMASKIVRALCARWPAVFALDGRKRKPPAVDIHRDVIAASAPGLASGKISKGALRAALAFYCRHPGYLHACKAGAARIDLCGAIAGTVTDSEAEYARGVLKARKAAKRAAKSQSAPADNKKLARAAVCATNNIGPSVMSSSHESSERCEASARGA